MGRGHFLASSALPSTGFSERIQPSCGFKERAQIQSLSTQKKYHHGTDSSSEHAISVAHTPRAPALRELLFSGRPN